MPGCRRAVATLTNLPVAAERYPVALLPTVIETVVRGDRRMAALVTNRPLRADLSTDLAMSMLLFARSWTAGQCYRTEVLYAMGSVKRQQDALMVG